MFSAIKPIKSNDIKFLTGFCIPLNESAQFYDIDKGYVSTLNTFLGSWKVDERDLFEKLLNLRNKNLGFMNPKQLTDCDNNLQSLAKRVGVMYVPQVSQCDRGRLLGNLLLSGNSDEFIRFFSEPLSSSTIIGLYSANLNGQDLFKVLSKLKNENLASLTIKQLENYNENLKLLADHINNASNDPTSQRNQGRLLGNILHSANLDEFIRHFCKPLSNPTIAGLSPNKEEGRDLFETLFKLRKENLKSMTLAQQANCDKNLRLLGKHIGITYTPPLSSHDLENLFRNTLHSGTPDEFIRRFCKSLPQATIDGLSSNGQNLFEILSDLRNKYLKHMTIEQLEHCDKNLWLLANNIGITYLPQVSQRDLGHLLGNALRSGDSDEFIRHFCKPLSPSIIDGLCAHEYELMRNLLNSTSGLYERLISLRNASEITSEQLNACTINLERFHEGLIVLRNANVSKMTGKQLNAYDALLSSFAEKIGQSYTPRNLSYRESEKISFNDLVATGHEKYQGMSHEEFRQELLFKNIALPTMNVSLEHRQNVCAILMAKLECSKEEKEYVVNKKITFHLPYGENIDELKELIERDLPRYEDRPLDWQQAADEYLASLFKTEIHPTELLKLKEKDQQTRENALVDAIVETIIALPAREDYLPIVTALCSKFSCTSEDNKIDIIRFVRTRSGGRTIDLSILREQQIIAYKDLSEEAQKDVDTFLIQAKVDVTNLNKVQQALVTASVSEKK
ncbi:MAG: hypothetical protein Q8L98_06610 [Chlamydiales bacterium]|nr:hypothetical protein [Chlamydiales bacterium]